MKRLVGLVALFTILGASPARAQRGTHTPTPTPTPTASCMPSSSITEYYLDSSGNPQSQVLTTLTKPVILDGIYADYHNAGGNDGTGGDCPTHTMNNGVQNCMNWEVPNDLVVEGPNPIGSITDANVNATITMFSMWGSSPYSTFTIPSINPTALTYTNATSPEWKSFGEVMDGTCYKDTVGNAGQLIGDIIETGGVYSAAPSLCDPNNTKCANLNRGVEHWVIVVMDNQGIQSNPQTSGEVSLDSRGTCAHMGQAFNTVSMGGGTTCPGTE